MKIALVQSALTWGEVDVNLDNFDDKLRPELHCDVILLPEMFVSGCMMVKTSREVAEAEKNKVAMRYAEVREKMKEWAGRQNALVMGSTVYKENDRYYNRMIVAFPDGQCLYYDKRHCFRMGGENEHFSAGEQQLVFDFRGFRIAAFICYDLRFPVWSRNTQAYDLAVYVANWPESRREVWNAWLKARAIENQAFVAAVNCVGEDNHGLIYAGDSAVWGAKGELVAGAGAFQEEILIADCNLESLWEFRRKFPVLEDRDNFQLFLSLHTFAEEIN